MKILFILDLYKPHVGGVEILFENIISGLVRKGNEVVVLTSRFDTSLPIYERISEKIEIYRVGSNRYNFMFFCLRKGIYLAKESDIIHTTTYNSALPASLIGFFSQKKVVLSVHEIFGKLWYKFLGWKGFFFHMFERIIFLFPFHKILCVSHYTKNSLRVHFGIVDKKMSTVYNGVDYEKWKKENFTKKSIQEIVKKYGLEGKKVGLYFGRPGISKGLEYFIGALPLIVKKIKNFKALIIVPQSDKKRCEYISRLIESLKVEKYVEWISSVPNEELGNYILGSDCVVVPSLAEGFGFAAAETCALGQKLVVSGVASLPEVVSGKVSFVEPGNSADIARGVIEILNGEYLEIPEKKFLWEYNIKATLDVYKELLGKKD